MKKRVRIDSTILSGLILFTAFMLLNKKFYFSNRWLDIILDFIGFICVFKGTLVRMLARGHKKSFSGNSEKLVTSGPYLLTRNPMYLGSFLLGCGFVLVVWPWWTLPLFALGFYWRFNHTISGEEKWLTEKFGQKYTDYCEQVPRLFPSLAKLKKLYFKQVFNLQEAFSTKEKRGLIGWPLLALLLESIQEWIATGSMDLPINLAILCNAAVVLLFVYWFSYEKA